MFALEVSPRAKGTVVETLHNLVNVSGLVITVQGSGSVDDLIRAILRVAPRLSEDHEVLANGLITSQVGAYRVIWSAVRFPGGSLAVLVPASSFEGQDVGTWTGHFMREVLDPVYSLSSLGYWTGGGGRGTVIERAFAEAFKNAYT